MTFSDGKSERPGAVIGKHKVLLRDIAWENGRDDPNRGEIRVPAAYLLPRSTPLSAEVKSGPQTFDFEVK